MLIKTSYISVNYADIMLRKGEYHNADESSLPLIPGIECSGIVVETGKDVKGIKEGDKVVTFGENCYAEYVTVKVENTFPFVLKDDMDMALAAAIPINYLTAYHMLYTLSDLNKSKTVLVYAAAGGVGSAIIQLGKLTNAKFLGITSTEEKAEFALTQGYNHSNKL